MWKCQETIQDTKLLRIVPGCPTNLKSHSLWLWSWRADDNTPEKYRFWGAAVSRSNVGRTWSVHSLQYWRRCRFWAHSISFHMFCTFLSPVIAYRTDQKRTFCFLPTMPWKLSSKLQRTFHLENRINEVWTGTICYAFIYNIPSFLVSHWTCQNTCLYPLRHNHPLLPSSAFGTSTQTSMLTGSCPRASFQCLEDLKEVRIDTCTTFQYVHL